jgi:hypothetical protein
MYQHLIHFVDQIRPRQSRLVILCISYGLYRLHLRRIELWAQNATI